MTKLIFTFRNSVNLPKNTTAQTAIPQPLALVKGSCVFDSFLVPKLQSSKI